MANRRAMDVNQNKSSRAASPASSKAPSPTEAATPRSQIDFQFLNFSHPQEAKGSRARRAVRSHVTRQQHQREHAAAAARRIQAEQQSPEATSSQYAPVSSSAQSSEGESQPPSPTTSPGTERVNIADLYPESWLSHVPLVVDHYISTMAIDIPAPDGSDPRTLLRSSFFQLIMTDAAALHCVVLAATVHFQNVNGRSSHPIDLLQLRGMAFREVNMAIHDPNRATSDQLIAAIAHLASYEAIHGDRAAFNTHMSGLQRMVTLRGGLPSLGLGGLLERILLWIDANATTIVGLRLYFDKDAYPTSAVHPSPHPQRFSGVFRS